MTEAEITRLSEQPLSLFGPDYWLDTELTSNFNEIVGRGEDAEYQDASLEVNLGDSIRLGFDLRLRPRGNSRLEACHFPPLILNFPKRIMRLEYLEDLDKIKIVAPCFSGEKYEQLVLREYLVYRLFQAITPESFRVRLLKQRWLDPSRADTLLNAFGFIIEEESRLEERLSFAELKDDSLEDEEMDNEALLLLALFEYMVGNQDWSVKGRHNIKIFEDRRESRLVPVPYDFDFTNLVNARYPKGGGDPLDLPPNPRVYKGPCREEAEFRVALDVFLEKEEDLRDVIRGFPWLPEGEAREVQDEIDSFYRIINNPARIRQLIQGACH